MFSNKGDTRLCSFFRLASIERLLPPLLMLALTAALGLMLAGRVSAQPFTTLYSFGTFPGGGSQPKSGLILSGNTLYGTAFQGGSSGFGTVFAINTDGSGFTNLYSFTNGSDGANPYAGLILSGNTLYGTALFGGSSNFGTVFAVNTDGSGFTNLYSFTNGSDGAFPSAGLVLSGSTLYGVTGAGIFAVNTDGTGFTNLYGFINISTNDSDVQCEGLVLARTTLYGSWALAAPMASAHCSRPTLMAPVLRIFIRSMTAAMERILMPD